MKTRLIKDYGNYWETLLQIIKAESMEEAVRKAEKLWNRQQEKKESQEIKII